MINQQESHADMVEKLRQEQTKSSAHFNQTLKQYREEIAQLTKQIGQSVSRALGEATLPTGLSSYKRTDSFMESAKANHLTQASTSIIDLEIPSDDYELNELPSSASGRSNINI